MLNRHSLYSGLVFFVIGIGVGWFAKESAATGQRSDVRADRGSAPANSVSKSESADAPPPPVAGKRAIRETPPKAAKPAPAVDSEEMKKAQSQMTKAMADRRRKDFERHLGKLTESLSLSDSQKADAMKWLDGKILGLAELDWSDPSVLMDKNGPLSALTTEALEKELEKGLTAEQKAALVAFKEKETRSKVDSMALKSLSQLQGVVDFNEGQRDEVYKILAAEAERKVTQEAETTNPASLFTEGMGIDLDPYDLGLHEAMTSGMSELTAGDEKSVMENLRKMVDDRINAKVELLRPVLDEKQLEQYRNELKSKGTGFLGGAMMGGVEVDSGSSTTILPAQ